MLADLALEVEAATALALRLARAFEAAAETAEHALARIATPAAKYWVCKRAPMVALEAMEVLGGNGYVEEAPLARIYREAPVNSIWEGSGNVICLDVIRVLRREPSAADALMQELHAARGANRDLDRHVAALADLLRESGDDGANGRRLAQAIAVALSAAVLVRDAPAFVADALLRNASARRCGARRRCVRALPSGVDAAAIVRRMQNRLTTPTLTVFAEGRLRHSRPVCGRRAVLCELPAPPRRGSSPPVG